MPGAGDEFITNGLDVVRDGFEERGVGFRVEGAEGGECFLGCGRGGLELFFGEQGIGRFQGLVGGGVETGGGLAFAGNRPAGDE